MSDVDLLGMELATASGRISSDVIGISRSKRIFAKIVPAALKSEVLPLFALTDLLPLYL